MSHRPVLVAPREALTRALRQTAQHSPYAVLPLSLDDLEAVCDSVPGRCLLTAAARGRVMVCLKPDEHDDPCGWEHAISVLTSPPSVPGEVS